MRAADAAAGTSGRLLPSVPLILGVLTTCVLGACGRIGPVRPPADVLPKTIVDLTATDTADGLQLSWSRPETYVDGSRMDDLAGFEIHRASPDGDFERAATVEVADRDRFRRVKHFRYLDRAIEAGVAYRYRVVSFTLDRYFSSPSNTVTAEHDATNEESHAPLPTPRR